VLENAVQPAGAARREPVAIPIGPGAGDGGLAGPATVTTIERERGGVAVTPLAARARVAEPAQSSVARQLVGEAPPRGGDTFGLSPREREVLSLIALGRTNREIGDRLYISQKTVGVHVGNILAKLGVSGRVEAATVAIRLRLTDPR